MRSAVTVRGWFVGETVVTVDSPHAEGAKSGKRPRRMEMERMHGKRPIRRCHVETE